MEVGRRLIKYVAIAVNACDAFVHYKPWTNSMNVWDHAAGVLCCEELERSSLMGLEINSRYAKSRKEQKKTTTREIAMILGACFHLKEKAVVVANDESLHKEILRAHNAAVELINDFSAGLGRSFFR